MYPILFRIGTFEITSFGVMLAIGALAGAWAFRQELDARGISRASDAAFHGLIGGLVGAKLLYAAEHLGTEPLFALLMSRGGMSWFGGLVGGVGVLPGVSASHSGPPSDCSGSGPGSLWRRGRHRPGSRAREKE